MNICAKILCFYSRLQDCAYLPVPTGLLQVGDALSSTRGGYAVHLRQLTQELSLQHWGLHRPTWWSQVLQLSRATEIKDRVFKKEHYSLAPTDLLTAAMAKDVQWEHDFLSCRLKLLRQKASRGRMTKLLTWTLGVEYTGFSLCCNTHRRSLAKKNMCTHRLVPCICASVYIHTCTLVNCSPVPRQKACAKRVECLWSLCTLTSTKLLFPVLVKNRRQGKDFS